MHSHRGQENFRLFFYQLSLDHESVQLIWNKYSRDELRRALTAEIKRFSRYQISQGHMKARWNHEDFYVTYSSLAEEIVVGGCYIRILSNIRSKVSFFGTVMSEDAFMEFSPDQILARRPRDLLMALYCRLLRENVRAEYHNDTSTALMCIKSMGIVASAYSDDREATDFDEVNYLLTLANETIHGSILEDITHTIRALCLRSSNAKRILRNRESLDLIVRLIQLVHSLNRDKAPVQSAKKLWVLESESGEKLGIADVRELKQRYESQPFDLSGLWVRREADPSSELILTKEKLLEVPQLRWELGLKSEIHKLQVAHDALSVLLSVARSNPLSEIFEGESHDEERSPVFPLPHGRTTLWSYVRMIIPLLLRVDTPVLATKTAMLLELVYRKVGELQGVESCHVSALFQWGVFYMVLASNCEDFTPSSGLLKWIHRLQDGFKGSSALLDLLPVALIEFLDSTSPSEFASVYTKGRQSPKVYWTEEMRAHLQYCCQVHFEDYLGVLEEDTTAEWNFCLMAPVSYAELADELWCGGVYLGRYCEQPDFPLDDPVSFMDELTKVWREDSLRIGSPLSPERAREILHADKQQCDEMTLRAKFKAQAIHLRDSSMFASQRRERMNELKEAFKVLTTPRRSLVTAGNDPVNLLLILHSLVLTCNRYPDALSLYEFDEYKLLLELLASHCTAEGIRPTDCSDDQVEEISVCAAELLFNTCAVSVINGDVLLQQKDLGVLERVINFCVGKMLDNSATEQSWVLEVCLYILQTVTGLSASPRGREWISGTTTLATDMVTILWFWHHSKNKTLLVSKLAQQVLEAVSRCAVLDKNQAHFAESGILWHLFRFITTYDATIDDKTVLARLDSEIGAGVDDYAKVAVEMQNLLAIMSVRALCRLGGLFADGSELASPKNPLVKNVTDALLTPNLSELILLPSHHEFLKLLHDDSESYTLFWNEEMRQELSELVGTKTEEPPSPLDSEDYISAVRFRFQFLADIFYVGGLYIETLMSSLFVLEQNPVPAADPTLGLTSKFFRELFVFIDNAELVCPRLEHQDGSVEELPPYAGWRIDKEQRQTVDRVTALNCLAITASVVPELVEKNIVADITAMKMLLRMLFPPDNEVHQSQDAEQSVVLSSQLYIPCRIHCIATLKVLSCMTEFGKATIPLGICDILIEMIHLCRDVGAEFLEIIRNLCAHGAREEYVGEILHAGSYLEFIAWVLQVEEIIMDDEFSIAERLRVPSALILAELVREEHPVCIAGRRALCRFFPAAIVRKIASDPEHVVEYIMADHETPELVWNNEFRNYLRGKMMEFLDIYFSATSITETDDGKYVSIVDSFEIDYSVVYPLPMAGNVYVEIYLHMPTFPLSDPLYFATSLWEEFQVLFRQLVHITSAYRAKLSRDDEAMVQRDIELTNLVASALVCCLQVNTSLLEKFAELQIPENCCVLLNDSVRQQVCEPCIVGVVRVLRVCSLSRACIESIEAVCPTLFTSLMGLLNPIRGGPLHFEAGYVLEIMRRIVAKYPEHGDRNASNGIVFLASRLDLFTFLLDILENPTVIGRVKEPNVVRAEAIEILNMLETDPIQGSTAHQILKKHKKWSKKYKFEATDVVRNLVTEDPFLHDLFPEADRVIREYYRSGGRTSERSSVGGTGRR